MVQECLNLILSWLVICLTLTSNQDLQILPKHSYDFGLRSAWILLAGFILLRCQYLYLFFIIAHFDWSFHIRCLYIFLKLNYQYFYIKGKCNSMNFFYTYKSHRYSIKIISKVIKFTRLMFNILSYITPNVIYPIVIVVIFLLLIIYCDFPLYFL